MENMDYNPPSLNYTWEAKDPQRLEERIKLAGFFPKRHLTKNGNYMEINTEGLTLKFYKNAVDLSAASEINEKEAELVKLVYEEYPHTNLPLSKIIGAKIAAFFAGGVAGALFGYLILPPVMNSFGLLYMDHGSGALTGGLAGAIGLAMLAKGKKSPTYF